MATKKETTKKPTKAKKVAAKPKIVAAEVLEQVEEQVETKPTDGKPTGRDAKLKQSRRKLVKDSQAHDADTGSTEVQIAILTGKINDLTKHLKEHAKDHDSRQGLLKMVGRRRRLLRFLKKGSEAEYTDLVKELKLRK